MPFRSVLRGPPGTPEYLGLVVLVGQRQVRRTGYGDTVNLGSELKCRILLMLMRERGSHVARARIREAWADVGRSDNPEDTTVDNEISDLRGRLEPLRVQIGNLRRVGWNLVDLDQEGD